MILNKNSWHYKAWKFSETIFKQWTPDSTNLCSYVRSIVLWLPLRSIGWVFLMALYSFMFCFHAVTAILSGYIPNKELKSEKRYPGIPIGSFHLYPWHVLLPAAIVTGVWFVTGMIGLMITCGFFTALAIAVLAIWFLVKSPKLEIFRAYVAAKKQGVCPLIEFE